MGLRSNLNLSEPIVIHWLDARCFAVTEPRRLFIISPFLLTWDMIY